MVRVLSYWSLESDGASGSCGLQNAAAAHRGLCSSPLHPTMFCSTGTTLLGQMATWEPQNKWSKPFFFFFTSTTCPNVHNLFISHLAWQENRSALEFEGGAELHFANCVSHDQSHKAYMHAKPCLFICLHDSMAISCMVMVFTCQILWKILQNSWPVHKCLYITETGFKGGCRYPNEFFPSNFFPSCRPGSIQIWLLCNQLSCWMKRPMQAEERLLFRCEEGFLVFVTFAGLLWMTSSDLKKSTWHNLSPSKVLLDMLFCVLLIFGW